MLVVVGNNHVLKKLDWQQDHVPNPSRSIRQYLTDRRSILRIFPIGQIIGKSVDDCDFRERFSDYEGTADVDLDEWFAGWRMGILQSIAIKPAEVRELLDGMVVY